ncbi:MAG: UDP-N-acetylenolpyruvoylglucosamine reductase [Parcubacteria group bacterium GW2011_GWC2_42_13]|nr:MAG: UDP-N-acetylenolpyruvoylglucosamine reductase [Parcubacteria group bacterium GW2011_GWC2_42_13]
MLNIRENVELAPLTTFRIGGPARYFAVVFSEEELKELLKWAREKKLPTFFLGGGSNILISDEGFKGLVIKIQNSKLEIKNSNVFAEAGILSSKVLAESINYGLTGLEWLVGIPGTIAGAMANNAGAYGKDMSAVVEKVKVLEVATLVAKEMTNKDCRFEYRESIFKGNSNYIILSVVLNLKKGNPEESRALMKEYLKQRSYKNSGRSAGCFFKNISWEKLNNKENFLKKFPELKKFEYLPRVGVGHLIDFLGLKGKSVGGAMISFEHASYIINKENAKAEDVIRLVNLVKEKIKARYGIVLENEVEVVG